MASSSTTAAVILVVDDEHSIADTLALILTRSGYAASATYSGESAIAFAKQTPPALIVSDIQMPGMDGIEASIEIRKLLPDCRVILFSGRPEAHIDRAKANGFSILAKPLSPQTLLKRIHTALQARAKKTSAGSSEN